MKTKVVSTKKNPSSLGRWAYHQKTSYPTTANKSFSVSFRKFIMKSVKTINQFLRLAVFAAYNQKKAVEKKIDEHVGWLENRSWQNTMAEEI